MESISESVNCKKSEDCINVSKNKRIKTKEKTIPRPPNAFMIFGQKFRKVLANEFKDLDNRDISKLLGEKWRKLDGHTKNQYHRLADEAHRKHLQKYPGYYYSPLEARQRKAERKRVSKMSRTNHKTTEDIHQRNNSFVGPFSFGNRPILFRNPIFPVVRPMFSPPFYPRMGFGPHFFGLRPNYSFPLGGMVPFEPMASHQSYLSGQVVKSECINGTDSHRCGAQTYQISLKSEPIEVESDNEIQMKYSTESTDIGLLSSLLPPMHNPNIEAVPVAVHQIEDYFSDQNSMINNEVTKMSNAIVDAIVQQEFVLPNSQQFTTQVKFEEDNQSIHIQSKVISRSNDH